MPITREDAEYIAEEGNGGKTSQFCEQLLDCLLNEPQCWKWCDMGDVQVMEYVPGRLMIVLPFAPIQWGCQVQIYNGPTFWLKNVGLTLQQSIRERIAELIVLQQAAKLDKQ